MNATFIMDTVYLACKLLISKITGLRQKIFWGNKVDSHLLLRSM